MKVKRVCRRCCLIQAVAKIAIGYWYKKNVNKYHSIRKMKKGKFPVYGYWEHKTLASIPIYKNVKAYSLYIYPVDAKYRSWTDVQVSSWCRQYFYTFLNIHGDPLGITDFKTYYRTQSWRNKHASMFCGHIL